MRVIYIDTGRKLSIEEMKEQLWRDAMNPYVMLMLDDELCFLNHLARKYNDEE